MKFRLPLLYAACASAAAVPSPNTATGILDRRQQDDVPATSECVDATFSGNTTLVAAYEELLERDLTAAGVAIAARPGASRCEVTVTFRAPDSSNPIRFRVYLPNAWTKKRFLTVGNGAFAGGFEIPSADLEARSGLGYAVMATDTGHASSVDDWYGMNWDGKESDGITNSHEQLLDWSWRAMYYSVPLAKEVVKAFYPDEESFKSYYHGCSTGGRQGLRQVELDSTSFDSILIGAPAWDIVNFMAWLSYIQAQARPLWENGNLPLDNLFGTVITRAKAICSTLIPNDNAAKEFFTDPVACTNLFREDSEGNPDPWPPGISDEHKNLIRKLISSVPMPGGESFEGIDITALENIRVNGYISAKLFAGGGDEMFGRYFIGPSTPVWTGEDGGGYWEALDTWDQTYGAKPSLDALSGFAGKMIMYGSTLDGTVPTPHTLHFYNSATGNKANRRYYEIPGMTHCSGLPRDPPWWVGPGGVSNAPITNAKLVDVEHDALEALIQWSENGADPSASNFYATAFQAGTWTPNVELPLTPNPDRIYTPPASQT